MKWAAENPNVVDSTVEDSGGIVSADSNPIGRGIEVESVYDGRLAIVVEGYQLRDGVEHGDQSAASRPEEGGEKAVGIVSIGKSYHCKQWSSEQNVYCGGQASVIVICYLRGPNHQPWES